MKNRRIFSRNGLSEWTIVELQGTLEISGPVDGRHFANLTWKEEGKTAELTIDHQLLEGQLVRLTKPFLVLDRGNLRDEEEEEASWLLGLKNLPWINQ
jgi:hypothetical protein